MKSMKRNGFSLMELLVSIAVIVVLGALVLAAFSKIREVSQRTNCAANLRSFGVAASIYKADNGGRILVYEIRNPDEKADSGNCWPQLMAPYMDDEGFSHTDSTFGRLRAFDCPTEVAVRWGDVNPSWLTSYAMFGSPSVAVYGDYVVDPSKKIYMGDSPWDGKRSSWNGNARLDASFSDLDINSARGIAFRHGGRANFLFHDGHVANFSPEELGDLNDPETYNARFNWAY